MTHVFSITFQHWGIETSMKIFTFPNIFFLSEVYIIEIVKEPVDAFWQLDILCS